jgi:hypothetical protein
LLAAPKQQPLLPCHDDIASTPSAVNLHGEIHNNALPQMQQHRQPAGLAGTAAASRIACQALGLQFTYLLQQYRVHTCQDICLMRVPHSAAADNEALTKTFKLEVST